MKLTPRMIVLVLLAAATLLVLSMAALGARLAAEQAVALRDSHNSSNSPTPTPTPTADIASDEEIIAIASSHFPNARLLTGGRNPIIFVSVDSEDINLSAEPVNGAIDEFKSLGGFETVTLLIEHEGIGLDTAPLEKLVTGSSGLGNQLIVQLD